MIELAIPILIIHLLTGGCILYAMTHDLGVFHKSKSAKLMRTAIIGWWLLHAEHIMKEGHYSGKQLASEVLLLIAMFIVCIALGEIKKQLR